MVQILAVFHYSTPPPPMVEIKDLFHLCPPPSTLCAPQLQSTCHYIVNHYVKILQVRLGGANNMRPLSWGGGGGGSTKGKDPKLMTPQIPKLIVFPITARFQSLMAILRIAPPPPPPRHGYNTI